MRDQEIVDLWEAYQQVCEAETARGPRLIDAYDKPPYSDDAAVAKNPVKMKRKGPKMKGVVSKEEVENVDEGMTMKDFKQQRSRQKQKEKRAAEKTSPTRRANMSSYERAVRHRASVDPDYDRDHEERDYPGGVTKNPKKIRKAKALGELGESVDLFDIILEHLVAEGYAETNEAALAIMTNMSEEWRNSIIEEETKRTQYLQKKFDKENAAKSGSAHTAIPGKQNTGQALYKARQSERQMRGEN